MYLQYPPTLFENESVLKNLIQIRQNILNIRQVLSSVE